MKKSIKLVSILMMAVMVVMVASPVFAADAIITNVEGQINLTAVNGAGVQEKVGKVISALQWIGIVGGVAILAIFGIKYMLGSLEEKAEYKKTMIPYIVGAVVVMAAPQIARLIFNAVA